MTKLQAKNRGNKRLCLAVDELLTFLEDINPEYDNLEAARPDADKVHSDGFYFFNLYVHRTFILLDFDDSEATIIWAGIHDEYERIFRNNKSTIEKWLRNNGYIR